MRNHLVLLAVLAGLALASSSLDAATLFYDRLFEMDPSGKAQFKQDMREQKKKLMQTLSVAVDGLSNINRLVPVLKDLGVRQCRVRVHGDVVRIEVDPGDVARLAEPDVRNTVVEGLKRLGYRYVTLDLEGFRSGSMNP